MERVNLEGHATRQKKGGEDTSPRSLRMGIAKHTVAQSEGIEEQGLDYLFAPRSIAVVGASNDPSKEGYRYFKLSLECGFKGPVYPVNATTPEVLGQRAYRSVTDIPGPLDYVISSIPARPALKLIQECAAKGVKVVHLYTAGFSETGKEEGRKLEAELLTIARRGRVRVLGPNCMGIHCPKTGLTFMAGRPFREDGRVAFISQSGRNAAELTEVGATRGLRFSKVVSYGNASDLNATDFLEYLASDSDTEIIAAYIEAPKEGQRFVKALKETAQRKPVIILKGGQTEAGARATASHTGSLAVSATVWDALCKQVGAIQVYTLEEMADLLLAFMYFSVPRGRRVGVIGVGGGASVQGADDCERFGLKVPQLPLKTRRMLREFTTEVGTSVGNPIDASGSFLWNLSELYQTIKVVAVCDQIDMLILHIPMDLLIYRGGGKGEVLDKPVETMLKAVAELKKPMAVVLRSSGFRESLTTMIRLQRKCAAAGFAAYPAPGRAALAIARLIDYHRSRGAAIL